MNSKFLGALCRIGGNRILTALYPVPKNMMGCSNRCSTVAATTESSRNLFASFFSLNISTDSWLGGHIDERFSNGRFSRLKFLKLKPPFICDRVHIFPEEQYLPREKQKQVIAFYLAPFLGCSEENGSTLPTLRISS